MVFLIVLSAAELASLSFFALAGGVVESPAVSALCDWGPVLESSDRAVSSECCKGFLVQDLVCCGFIY